MVTTVGIVDDSIIVRSALKTVIDGHPEFRVIGMAEDPFAAREMILDEQPDVLTLDVEMPKLDGLTFLKRLMDHHPLPVVMVSSLTDSTTRKGMQALEAGAVDVVGKPEGDTQDSINELKHELIPKLQAAARANLPGDGRSTPTNGTVETEVKLPDSVQLIVFGASTGGTTALLEVFRHFPQGLPPILIAQHMPSVFTKQFAAHLDEDSAVSVREAEDDGYVETGQAVLAPGDRHLVVDGSPRGDRAHFTTNDDEKVCFQRPAVDPLFQSAARHAKDRVIGVVLTGMGKDGVDGSRCLAEAGGRIFVQDEESCSVYGMPKRVRETVSSAREVPLNQLGPLLARLGPSTAA